MENYGRFNVFVRVRPVLPTDIENKHLLEEDKKECVSISKSSKEILLTKANYDDRRFIFDHVLGYNANQSFTYKYVAENIVNEVIDGYNGTIMAYGQTGSGKTHTIFGPKKSFELVGDTFTLNKECGILFRAISQLFQYIEENSKNRQFRVHLGFFQIYMENIHDLLDDNIKKKDNKDNLQIRESPTNGIYVHGLSQVVVTSLFEVLNLIKQGVRNRMTQSTTMNKTSSRSHAILQLTLEQRWLEESEEPDEDTDRSRGRAFAGTVKIKKKHVKKSVLSIVDLAGSERLSKSNSEGLRFEEAKNINKSISTLGMCIAALAAEKKKTLPIQNGHVPYRDSKLTRILSDSLGIRGNSKTSICACIGPTSWNYDESFSTLLFASRAMSVKINPHINEDVFIKSRDTSRNSSVSIEMQKQSIENRKLKEEVEFLRNQLSQSPMGGPYGSMSVSSKSLSPLSRENSFNQTGYSRKDSETYHEERFRTPDRNESRYEKPFVLTSTTKDNTSMEQSDPSGYTKREQEIIRKYTSMIETLQGQLVKRNAKIAILEEKLGLYIKAYGDINS